MRSLLSAAKKDYCLVPAACQSTYTLSLCMIFCRDRLLLLHLHSRVRLHSNDRFAVWEACLVSSTTVRQELCKRVHGDVEGVRSVKKRARTDTS